MNMPNTTAILTILVSIIMLWKAYCFWQELKDFDEE